MANRLEHQPFKNRAHVMAEIKRCALAGSIFQVVSFLFAALGVISAILKTALGLDSIAWFLFAIFASLHGVVPNMHVVLAKHLLGIEAENKKEQ